MSDFDVRADGTRLTARVGDTITIRLAENGGTGYQWSVDDLPVAVALVDSSLRWSQPMRPGAAGERVVVLRAQAVGAGRARLSLSRVFEPHPIETFAVDVEVTDP